MSVAELPGRPSSEYERTPPQDVAAEQCVLGGMLLSKDAIADVVEVIRSPDFYRPAHELIYDAVLDLYGRGEPADAVTVSAELTKRGDIGKVGGAPYLHTLISSVPTAANAGYYARIVRERAVLRRLVAAGTKIVQMGYATGGGDVDEIVDAAQAEVYSVTERRTSEDYAPLSAIMEGALDEIEAISSRDGQMIGVPTGFNDLDQLTNGLHPGQLVVVAARPAMGKALALDTALPTPTGWTTMGAVRVGDELLGADGRPARVVAATAVLVGRPCFEVEFSDGQVIVADAEHQWLTEAQVLREPVVTGPAGASQSFRPGPRVGVRSTAQLAATLRRPGPSFGPNHRVVRTGPRARDWFVTDVRPVASVPVRCVEVGSPDHLYLAGSSMVPTHNSTLGLDFSRACSIKNGLASVIFSLEMSRNEITMRLLSAEARVALHHMRSGTMTDEDWARLARRMGEVSAAPLFIDDSPNMSMMEIRAKCRRLKQRHDLRMVVVDYMQLMQGSRRVESRQQEVSEMSRSLKLLAKELEVPVVAISQLNRGPEQRTDKKPQLSDLRECLTGDTLVTRCDTGAQVPIGDLVGQRDVPVWSLDEHLKLCRSVMTDVWRTGVRLVFRVTLASGRWVMATANHPFRTVHGWRSVDSLSVGSHLAVARLAPKRLAQERPGHLTDLTSVLEPGGKLLESVWKAPPRRERGFVSDPCLEDLARSDVDWDRVVAIEAVGERDVYDAHVPETHSFLANGVVSHNSGAIEQDADMVILLHREDAYERESPRAGEADLIVAKHRNGPTATVTVAFQGHYSRFIDMAIS